MQQPNYLAASSLTKVTDAKGTGRRVWGLGRSPLPPKPLTLSDRYPCPICQYGQIAELTLMDAFACDFCRHIFATNLSEQTVQVVDSAQSMGWRWNGRRWQPVVAAHTGADHTTVALGLWLVGILLVTLPPLIVGAAVYIFPPLPDSRWPWFPLAWLACTFAVHLGMVSWLLAEYYQLPIYVTGKFWVRQLLRPLQG